VTVQQAVPVRIHSSRAKPEHGAPQSMTHIPYIHTIQRTRDAVRLLATLKTIRFPPLLGWILSGGHAFRRSCRTSYQLTTQKRLFLCYRSSLARLRGRRRSGSSELGSCPRPPGVHRTLTGLVTGPIKSQFLARTSVLARGHVVRQGTIPRAKGKDLGHPLSRHLCRPTPPTPPVVRRCDVRCRVVALVCRV